MKHYVSVLMPLQLTLAVISLGLPNNTHIASSSAGYPIQHPRFVSDSVVSNGGAFWFYCPPMFTFMILLNQIVTEKQEKLRMGMKIMGL